MVTANIKWKQNERWVDASQIKPRYFYIGRPLQQVLPRFSFCFNWETFEYWIGMKPSNSVYRHLLTPHWHILAVHLSLFLKLVTQKNTFSKWMCRFYIAERHKNYKLLTQSQPMWVRIVWNVWKIVKTCKWWHFHLIDKNTS